MNKLDLITVIFEGISNIILFINLHPSKALESIKLTEEGIVILVSDKQSLKQKELIFVTFEVTSNIISSNDLHPSKALKSIRVTEEGIDIFFNDKQRLKQ